MKNSLRVFLCGLALSLSASSVCAMTELVSTSPGYVPQFESLGPQYRIGNLIWSGVAEAQMNWQDAVSFCKELGATLPSKQDFLEMTVRSRIASLEAPSVVASNSLPGMNDNAWFWVSSAHDVSIAWIFGGSGGDIGFSLRKEEESVRCVKSMKGRGWLRL